MYIESGCSCDWCKKRIDDRESVACEDCYERLEEEVAELKRTVGELEAKVFDLESEIEANRGGL